MVLDDTGITFTATSFHISLVRRSPKAVTPILLDLYQHALLPRQQSLLSNQVCPQPQLLLSSLVNSGEDTTAQPLTRPSIENDKLKETPQVNQTKL